MGRDPWNEKDHLTAIVTESDNCDSTARLVRFCMLIRVLLFHRRQRNNNWTQQKKQGVTCFYCLGKSFHHFVFKHAHSAKCKTKIYTLLQPMLHVVRQRAAQRIIININSWCKCKGLLLHKTFVNAWHTWLVGSDNIRCQANRAGFKNIFVQLALQVHLFFSLQV